MLEVKGLTKAFGGIVAVSDVSFHVTKGEIVAVIGPNGAGKTTLFNLISSVIPPSSGTVTFKGERLDKLPLQDLISRGITRTFQNLEIFGSMTVVENVMLGTHVRLKTNVFSAGLCLKAVKQDDELAMGVALDALKHVGLADHAYDVAGNLPYGKQKLLEVARAIVSDPDLILLDEPMAGLNDGEGKKLADFIQEQKAGGRSFLFVEHDMTTVMKIADRIIVLDFGGKIAEGTPTEIQQNEKVIAAYLGEEVY